MPSPPPARVAAAGLALLGPGLGAGGCRRVRDLIGEQVQASVDEAREERPSAAPEAPGGPGSGPEQLAQKLQLYVACLGRSRDRIERSFTRYGEDVDVGKGTPQRRGARPFLYPVDTQLVPCREAVAEGPELAPPLPEIEAAAASYLGAAELFAGLDGALHDYYDAAGYEQDDWATSKALAPAFAATYDTWRAAAEALAAKVATEKDQVDRQLLDLLEQREGKKLRWQIRNFVLRAAELTACARDQERPATACAEPGDALEQAHESLTQWLEQHADEADAVFWMSAFRASLETFWAASQEALDPKRKGKVGASERQDLVRSDAELSRAADNLRFDLR